MEHKIDKIKVTSGDLYPYLKEIVLFGRIRTEEEGSFVIYGCPKEDEKKFYEGILAYDEATGILGLKTVEQVEEFWINGCDGMFLIVDNYDYLPIEYSVYYAK